MTDSELENILKPLTRDQLKTLNKSDLIELLLGEQSIRLQQEEIIKRIKEERANIAGKYVLIRTKMFSPSSEKTSTIINKDKTTTELTDNADNVDCNSDSSSLMHQTPEDNGKNGKRKYSKRRILLPGQRYPNAPIVDQDIELEEAPICSCCSTKMEDSGMVDIREKLTVEPRKFVIKRQHYHKYRCPCCHGDIKTTPTIPQITPGSAYDDEMVITTVRNRIKEGKIDWFSFLLF